MLTVKWSKCIIYVNSESNVLDIAVQIYDGFVISGGRDLVTQTLCLRWWLFLHLHLSESSPASCDERPQSEQATRKFAFSTLISFRWSYTSLQVTLLLRTSSENTFFPYSFVFPTVIFSIICFASALAGRLAFSIRRSLWQEVNSNINIVWAFKTNNNNKKKTQLLTQIGLAQIQCTYGISNSLNQASQLMFWWGLNTYF